jgi:YD repeat-containing protein
MTTYTYKPLIGMTSETDPNGRTQFYEYDAFGRLSLVRDKDNNVLKKVCYNFSGQIENCNSTPVIAVNFTNSVSNPYIITLTNTNTLAVYIYSLNTSTVTLQAGIVPTGNYNIQISPTNTSQNVQLIFNGVTHTGTSFTLNNTTISADVNLSLSNAGYTGTCTFSPNSGWSSSYNYFYSSNNTVNFNLVLTFNNYFNSGVVYTVGSVGVGCRPSTVRSFLWISSSYSYWYVLIYPTGTITMQLVNGPVPPPGSYLSLYGLSYNL